MAADDRGAARHELGEGIARPPQNPQLRRVEAGVVLGHRHSARPDFSGNEDLPLGHRIGGSVRGVSADDDVGPRIQPADIVGGGSHDVDPGSGEAHGPDPLPRCAENAEKNGFLSRPPESPSEAVLTLGDDLDMPVSFGDGLLKALLQDARIDADALFGSGNDDGRFLRHDLSWPL